MKWLLSLSFVFGVIPLPAFAAGGPTKYCGLIREMRQIQDDIFEISLQIGPDVDQRIVSLPLFKVGYGRRSFLRLLEVWSGSAYGNGQSTEVVCFLYGPASENAPAPETSYIGFRLRPLLAIVEDTLGEMKNTGGPYSFDSEYANDVLHPSKAVCGRVLKEPRPETRKGYRKYTFLTPDGSRVAVRAETDELIDLRILNTPWRWDHQSLRERKKVTLQLEAMANTGEFGCAIVESLDRIGPEWKEAGAGMNQISDIAVQVHRNSVDVRRETIPLVIDDQLQQIAEEYVSAQYRRGEKNPADANRVSEIERRMNAHAGAVVERQLKLEANSSGQSVRAYLMSDQSTERFAEIVRRAFIQRYSLSKAERSALLAWMQARIDRHLFHGPVGVEKLPSLIDAKRAEFELSFYFQN